MARFVRGDVVVVPFPFSDLSQSKKRPALVASHPQGSLNRRSNIRPNRIFTADENIVLYKIGHLKSTKLHQVTESIVQILHE